MKKKIIIILETESNNERISNDLRNYLEKESLQDPKRIKSIEVIDEEK